MNLRDMFKQKPRTSDADLDGIEDMAGNDETLRKQRLMLGGGALAALLIGGWYILDDGEGAEEIAGSQRDITVETDAMVNRNMSEREWMAVSEDRFQSIENQLRGYEGRDGGADGFPGQFGNDDERANAMARDGNRVIGAYQAENNQLRAQLAAAQASQRANPRTPPSARPAPRPLAAPVATAAALAPNAASPGTPASLPRNHDVNMVSFAEGSPSAGPRITENTTSYSDSPNYLPPNSIATARVIVGVNASAGVSSQSDPLPVVLRITGPARSVYNEGQLMQTHIEGCLINGAARGDLSSERIYVKLQRMTCPQTNGRYAVANVRGFLAFGGMTGVRGRVVSREGSLATQAMFAGIISGFGEGLSRLGNPLLSGGAVIAGPDTENPSVGDVVMSGLGQGARQTGSTVSEYLIERAEQYQPVVEMPTGIDVEVVFLEGVFIQS